MTGSDKLGAVVEKNDLLVAQVQHQVEPAAPACVLETECDGQAVLSIADQGGANVDDRLAGIPGGEFDHQHVAVQVEGQEVAGMRRIVMVMPHHRIDLKGTRSAVMPRSEE